MKKSFIYLLSAVLLCGCVQNEKQPEPPIEENSQEVDNKQETEEYVKKIDQSQGWFTILETREVLLNGNSDDDETNLSDMKELEVWINQPLGDTFIREFPFINIDSEDAKQRNISYRNRECDDPNEPQGTVDTLAKFYPIENDKVLSIIVFECIPIVSENATYRTFYTLNFDLEDGHIMSATEMLKKHHLTINDYFSIVDSYENYVPTFYSKIAKKFNLYCRVFEENDKLYTFVSESIQLDDGSETSCLRVIPLEYNTFESTKTPEETIDISSLIEIKSETVDMKDTNADNLEKRVIDYVNIFIDSEDAQKINQLLNEQAEKYANELTFYPEDDPVQNGHWKTAAFYHVKASAYKDVLSVSTKLSRMLFEAGSAIPEYDFYNLEISTGKQLNNEELLNKFGYSLTEVQKMIDEYCEKENIAVCSNNPDSKRCYFNENIQDDSMFFVDEEGLHFALQTRYAHSAELVIEKIERRV